MYHCINPFTVFVIIGLDISNGYGALFDLIERDDDGGLSLEEFQKFFMSAGWMTSALAKAAVGVDRSVSSAGGSRTGRSLNIHLLTQY